MHSQATANKVKSMLRQGYRHEVIAARLGVSRKYVDSAANGEQDNPAKWMRADNGAYVPDHEAIALGIAEIQKKWTEAERERRSAQSERTKHWSVPTVSTAEADWGSVEESSLI